MKVVDRIDLSRKQKIIAIINNLAIAYVGAWVLGIVFLKDTLDDIGLDDFRALIMPFPIYFSVMKIYSVDKDLFIEWRETELEYKTQLESGCIDLDLDYLRSCHEWIFRPKDIIYASSISASISTFSFGR